MVRDFKIKYKHTPCPSQEGTMRLFILRYLLKSQIRLKDIEFEIEKTQLSLLEKGRRDVLEW